MHSRQRVLAGLLVAAGLCTLLLLWDVVATVFFAVTVAYVLYPVRRRLVGRGLDRRVAAGVCTTFSFLAVLVLALPAVWALYERRERAEGFPCFVVTVVATPARISSAPATRSRHSLPVSTGRPCASHSVRLPS